MSGLLIPVYHITHVDNLPSIINDGCLWSDFEQQKRGNRHQKIGYEHIKKRRLQHLVQVAKRGTLGQYVPFYFAPRSIMLYVIHKGKGYEHYKGGQEPIVHLVGSAMTIADRNNNCFFTDRHAELAYAQQCDDLTCLKSVIDFNVLRKKYWAETQDEKEKRQAEFLVYRCYPWNAVEEIGVHNAEIALKVQTALEHAAHKPRISVRRDWYYDQEKTPCFI